MPISKRNTYPISIEVTKTKLMELLNTRYKFKLFCIHDWVYWNFKGGTRSRRVCKKCFKKQQHSNPLSHNGGRWIKDNKYV